MQTYIVCVLLKLGKSMVIQSREENPRRLGTVTPGNSKGAEIHLPENRDTRRRRGMDRLMHAQCIRCRQVQIQTVEQIRTVRSMVSQTCKTKGCTERTLSRRQQAGIKLMSMEINLSCPFFYMVNQFRASETQALLLQSLFPGWCEITS